jgi:hypothetical protein
VLKQVTALVIQRLNTFGLVRKGWIAHSHYAGYPTVAMRFTKSVKIARDVIEPLFCLFAGTALLGTPERLGKFVMAGFCR